MNFFHNLFKSKLDAMRAAAPRASIHLLHESNGFSIYLDEATAVRKVTQLGTLTDHAEDILEETVPVLFIPLEQCVKFVEEVTASHSVGLVDVILADKVNNARYVMYAYFGKRNVSPWPQAPVFQDDLGMLINPPEQLPPALLDLEHFNPGPDALQFLTPVVALPDKPETVTYPSPTQEEYDRVPVREPYWVAGKLYKPGPDDFTQLAFLGKKEKDSLDADFWG